ncbi:STAS domain-containing protein [Streptomyces sp. NPDC005803]|uniref:STAS domain-containing protein n=1 Tax=Streptomyces sp. NPDC005803 TaxID=3154297 RepID=UPI003404F198
MNVHPFTSRVVVRSGVVRVILVGELDLDSGFVVQEAVTACLAKEPPRLCLDLAGVSFCDCAGLSALLRARIAVLRAGVDLVVEGVGPQLARLLRLIGADDILTAGNTRTAPESADGAPAGTAAAPRADGTAATTESPFRELA